MTWPVRAASYNASTSATLRRPSRPSQAGRLRSASAATKSSTTRRCGVASATTAVDALLVALVNVYWLDSPSGRLGFKGLQQWTEPGFARAFTSWIAWVLVAVTLVFGVAACVRWRAASPFRYTGAILAVVGAFMAVVAVLLLAYQTDDDSFHVARNYSVGPYLEVLGLLIAALGTAAGTGRRG